MGGAPAGACLGAGQARSWAGKAPAPCWHRTPWTPKWLRRGCKKRNKTRGRPAARRDPSYWGNRAACHLKLGAWQAALDDARLARSIDASYVKAW